MRKKKILLISLISIALVFLFLYYQTGKTATLRGKGDNWKASYAVNDYNISYTIAYIGEEKVPKTIDYVISPIYGGQVTESKNYQLNSIGVIRGTEIAGDIKLQDDESIYVKISWDGKEEILNLSR